MTTIEAPTLQPGCIICANTIPEKKAKFRSLTCSDDCAKIRRNARLTPAKYRDLALHCLVCRGPIPEKTAKKGGATCGAACRNELRRYRWAILKMQKCPHCYHPSSPAEWERYRRWRASEGPMQAFIKEAAGRGNLAWKREKELREALKTAMEIIRGELKIIFTSYGDLTVESDGRPTLSEDGERFAAPLEKWIELATPLLDPRKRKVDTEAAQ